MEFNEDIEKLKGFILEGNVVFFGGAGVSTVSGMKDFRSEDGLYNEKNDFKYPPETILSKTFFYKNPTEFYRFYRQKMNCLGFEPNIIHTSLAKWEEEGLLKGIITQNIDNLHQEAGSQNVIELHGTAMRNFCDNCGEPHDIQDVFYGKNDYPVCEKCGGLIRPDIVLYGEMLNQNSLMQAEKLLNTARTLIVAGSSLTVNPAANLVSCFYGPNLVILNKQKVANEKWADIVIHDDMKKVFEALRD